MLRRLLSRSRLAMAVMVLVAALAGTAAATGGPAPVYQPQVLPSPQQFMAYLDFDCFRTSAYTPPPLPAPITLTHLNPVLAGAAPWTIANLGPRTQLCAPVAKNDVLPPPNVLQYIRNVDLSCYQITGPNINFPLTLNHLNPQLAHLPSKQVTMMAPAQLCVPVTKNNAIPPPEVLNMVRYIDTVCYRALPQVPLNIPLKLTQLNPVLTGIAPVNVQVRENRQLCVPVRKNNQAIPPDVLNVARWVDYEKYDIIAPQMAPWNLTLHHINPLLQGLPAEPATLLAHQQVGLPVAKNGHFPPAT